METTNYLHTHEVLLLDNNSAKMHFANPAKLEITRTPSDALKMAAKKCATEQQ